METSLLAEEIGVKWHTKISVLNVKPEKHKGFKIDGNHPVDYITREDQAKHKYIV